MSEDTTVNSEEGFLKPNRPQLLQGGAPHSQADQPKPPVQAQRVAQDDDAEDSGDMTETDMLRENMPDGRCGLLVMPPDPEAPDWYGGDGWATMEVGVSRDPATREYSIRPATFAWPTNRPVPLEDHAGRPGPRQTSETLRAASYMDEQELLRSVVAFVLRLMSNQPLFFGVRDAFYLRELIRLDLQSSRGWKSFQRDVKAEWDRQAKAL